MSWFKVDDAFHSHPKVLTIPRSIRPDAIGTWTLAGTWCAQHETDGRIPVHMLEEVGGTLEGAKALVAAKLWAKRGKFFEFLGWSDYQPTKAQKDAEREANRVRKANQRKRSQSQPESRDGHAGVPVGHGREAAPPVPSRPDPVNQDSSPSVTYQDRESAQGTDESDAVRVERLGRLLSADLPKVRKELAGKVGRIVSDAQLHAIVMTVMGRTSDQPRDWTGFLITAIRNDWAEFQKFVDEDAA